MIALEVRNLQPDLLRGYVMAERGGVQRPDGSVAAHDGSWVVRFIELPPARLGRFTIPAQRIEVEGDGEEALAAYLRRMTMRGGG